MRAAPLALALLSAAPLAAETHWALRSVTSLLRESPVERQVAVLLPGNIVKAFKHPAFEHELDLQREQSLRLYGGQDAGDWRLEWNLLGQTRSATDPVLLPGTGAEDGRSQALQGGLHQEGFNVEGEVDQLNLRWQGPRASAVLGRQPVNLGQSFYFSPLDLFAPFAASSTYRDFRAGVDALRLSASPSEFSLVEGILVGAFVPAGGSLPERLDLSPLSGGGGALLRAQANGSAWSFTALGGRVRDQALLGAGLQLEFWGSSWGAEGAWSVPAGAAQASGGLAGVDQRPSLTLSHSRQWTPSLNERIELSAGATARYAADGSVSLRDDAFQGVASLQAQASPLWTLSGAAFYKGTDAPSDSVTLQLGAERSLSDESVLGLTLGLPFRWDGQFPGADSALLPYSLSVELRTTL